MASLKDERIMHVTPWYSFLYQDVFTIDTIPGALPPFGIFDPAGLAARADEPTLKRYREAELTHGRVAMLATVGFLAGEKVEGSSFLFDASIRGPAISHLSQVPAGFWFTLALFITLFEIDRAKYGWVSPRDLDVDKPGLLRAEYIPGKIVVAHVSVWREGRRQMNKA